LKLQGQKKSHEQVSTYVPRSFHAMAGLSADRRPVGAIQRKRHFEPSVCWNICRSTDLAPDNDVEVFTQWAEALSPVFFVMTPEQIADATRAITELQTYVDGLTTRRAQDPGSDLVTALLAAEADGERLTHAETVDMIANLLVAGHDTAGSQIPCSALVALQHYDQLTGVHEDEVRLASAAAETMRLEPSC
jgi:cytochrome P450